MLQKAGKWCVLARADLQIPTYASGGAIHRLQHNGLQLLRLHRMQADSGRQMVTLVIIFMPLDNNTRSQCQLLPISKEEFNGALKCWP